MGSWRSGDGRRVLGHTRLSIIGAGNGRQPIASADGDVQIVVNGEFYGYRHQRSALRAAGRHFRTDSDSEVALHLYQTRGVQGALAELRGEFAFIIADETRKMLVAARDRFGVKPLYYAVIAGDIYFGSEIKALVALGVEARWNLEAAVAESNQSHERTLFAEVHAVPPGHYAIAVDGDLRLYPYWDWIMPTSEELRQDVHGEVYHTDAFRAVLRDAVRERLVADVEVGCYLSGGIDSCAVLGLAQEAAERPIRAFTLSFDDAVFDEAAVAQKQAAHVGASFERIDVKRRDLAAAYADAVWSAETPMFNGHGVAKFLLSRAVNAAGIKCVLTGEGADELFGGYPPFRVDAIVHDPRLDPAEKRRLLDDLFASNEAMRAVMLPEKAEHPDLAEIEARLGWLSAYFGVYANASTQVSRLFTPEMAALANVQRPGSDALDRLPLSMAVAGRDRLNQILYVMSKTNLPNLVLCYLGDRMEMAHSVEGRVPFLDHLVAEQAACAPIDLKIRGTREKHLLREAAKSFVLPEVYDRQKHPFSTPPVGTVSDPMIEFYRDTFSSRAAAEQPVFDMKKVQDTLDRIMEIPADERIASEAVLHRAAGIVVMQDRFGLT